METGIPGMDDLIDGGIPQGNMVLVSGNYGTGKTTFALQYIGKGVETYGEFGVFVTFVDDIGIVLDTGKHFGWALKRWKKAGSLKLLGGAGGRLQGFSKDAKSSGRELTDEILEVIKVMGAERFALDGLNMFAEFFETEHGLVANLARLRRELRNLGCTSIVTSAPESGPEQAVDGLIILNYDGGIEKSRAVEVGKMRRSSHTDRLCPFEITGMGIVVTGPPKEE